MQRDRLLLDEMIAATTKLVQLLGVEPPQISALTTCAETLCSGGTR